MAWLEIGLTNAILATCLALVVAVVCRIYPRPAFVYCLWLIVLLKLVTPPLIHIPFAPFAFAESPETEPRVGPSTPSADADLTRPVASRSADRSDDAQVPRPVEGAGLALNAAAPSMLRNWPECVALAWSLGTLVYLVVAIRRIVAFQRLLNGSERAPRELREASRSLAARLGLSRPPQILVTDGNIAPLVWCVSAGPQVVFPRKLLTTLTPDHQASLLAHELAHLRRRDHWVRWLELIVTALYWWHPVTWWARRQINRAGDQCCDSWVLWAFPSQARGYAEALLTTIDFLADAKPDVPALASTIGPVHFLERRIEMILRNAPRKDLSWASRLTILAAALVLLPLSSRLVAFDKPGDETSDASESSSDESAQEGAKPGAEPDPQPTEVVIPKAGILEVAITVDGQTTRIRKFSRAIALLRAHARRPQPEQVVVVIQVNDASREFTDLPTALRACEAVSRVVDAAKQAKIKLGELGSIEAAPSQSYAKKPDPYAAPVPSKPDLPRRGRDGDDGYGVRGGLGGQSGGGPSDALASPSAVKRRGSSGQTGGAGAAGGRDQYILALKQSLTKALFGDQGQSSSGSDGVFAGALTQPLGEATLMSRMVHRDYQTATFSFEFALRDDPMGRIGNDWDLQYGNDGNHFHVTMVSDDLSRMVDLGESTWDKLDSGRLPVLAPHARPQREMVPAVEGHMYLVHTVDRNTDLYALFRVEQITPQGACDITWRRVEADDVNLRPVQ